MPSRRLLPPVVALAALVVLLAGCADDRQQVAPERPDDTTSATVAPGLQRYVALGDSYTAAPGVPVTDLAEGCFRSDGNYPALVAEQLDTALVDVSCSGADTSDVTSRQLRGVPPQARALTPDTDLVTVGLGGNDGGLFQQLVSRCRAVAPEPGSTELTGETCPGALSDADVQRLRETLQTTRGSLVRVLDLVERRSPDARVLVVGYPQIVAAERGCDLLPLTDADRRHGAALNRELDRTLRRAADQAGAEFVDVYAATRGHDICAEEPWVNGIVTDQRRALAFHPFAEEQQAVADLVLEALQQS